MGVGSLGPGLHRLVGMDDPWRDERDPAHHHRRARSRTAPRAGGKPMTAESSHVSGSAGFPGLPEFSDNRDHAGSEIHEELRAVARDLLARTRPETGIDWRLIAEAGWLGLEAPGALDGADATFAEVAVVLQE